MKKTQNFHGLQRKESTKHLYDETIINSQTTHRIYWIFWFKRIWYFGLCWNLRLVIELWYLQGFCFLWEDVFEEYIFAWWNIWIFIILLLPWDTFYCKWQGHSVTHPLLWWLEWSLLWWVKKALEKENLHTLTNCTIKRR